MTERQMPSLAVFEECEGGKCLHWHCLRHVRAQNAFPCSVSGMTKRQMPSLAVFEECEGRQMPSLAVFETCESAKCLPLRCLRMELT
eukprot:3247481-Amphidinium_carterae.4